MNDSNNFCDSCGAPLAPDARFCDSCGNPVSASPPPPAPDPSYPPPIPPPPPPRAMPASPAPLRAAAPATGQANCPSCGAPNIQGSAFCNSCGARTASPAGQTEAIAPDTSTSWAWWLLPIFLLFVGGVIGWRAVKNKNKGKARGILILGIVTSVVYMIWWFTAQ